jgi:hypothetical protein
MTPEERGSLEIVNVKGSWTRDLLDRQEASKALALEGSN